MCKYIIFIYCCDCIFSNTTLLKKMYAQGLPKIPSPISEMLRNYGKRRNAYSKIFRRTSFGYIILDPGAMGADMRSNYKIWNKKLGLVTYHSKSLLKRMILIKIILSWDDNQRWYGPARSKIQTTLHRN